MFQRTASNTRSGSRWRNSRIPRALGTTDNPATSSRPELAAEAILHASTARRPRTRYPVGASAAATTFAWAA